MLTGFLLDYNFHSIPFPVHHSHSRSHSHELSVYSPCPWDSHGTHGTHGTSRTTHTSCRLRTICKCVQSNLQMFKCVADAICQICSLYNRKCAKWITQPWPNCSFLPSNRNDRNFESNAYVAYASCRACRIILAN